MIHKYITVFALIILLVLGPLVYLTLRKPKGAEAAWFDDSWAYRKAISIPSHTSAETNVYVTVPTFDATDTSKFQADCGDLRFTKQNGELLPYYVVDCDATANIHVLFDTLPAGASTYYLYYGNPSASNGFEAADFSNAASGLGTQTLAAEEKSAGPVAYWKFDEGYGGTANDSTQNANTGSLGVGASAPTWQTEDMCISGKCLKFDGSNDYVDAGTGTSLDIVSNAFTLSFWVKLAGQPASGKIMNMVSKATLSYSGSGFGFGYDNRTGTPSFDLFKAGVADQRVAYTLSTGVWYHIEAVQSFSGGNPSLVTYYVNGSSVGTSSNASAYQSSSGQTAYIGGKSSYADSVYLNGFIDEVKIYPYARTPAQIKSDYAAGLAHTSSVKGVSASLGSDDANLSALNNGLVGYWKMDEASGNAIDSSGNSNTGTWAGSGSHYVAGKFGNGGGFGTNDTVAISHNSVLKPSSQITISAWVKPTNITTNTYYEIYRKEDGSDRHLLSFQDNGTILSFGLGTATQGYQELDVSVTASNYTDGWHLITATYDGQNKYLYRDGVQIGTQVATGAIGTTGSANAYIGSSGGSSEFFAGNIDEVRLYNRALSPKEVRDLYNWAPGSVIYYDFNEHTGTSSINDKSGNGYTATLTSMAESDWTTGKYGSSLEFDGTTNQYARVSSGIPAQGQNITVETWVYPTTISDTGNDRNNFAYSSYFMALGSHKFNVYTPGTSSQGWHTSNGSTSTNQWQHLAFTYDGANMRMYINGMLDKTVPMTGSLTSVATLDIGRRPDSPSNPYLMQGKVDDYRVYNYARTAKQIVEDMNVGHPAGGSPVGSAVGYWKFDEGYGTTVNNVGIGGTALNGTLGVGTSAPTWTNEGKFGKALSFDGSNDYATINTNLPTLTEGTLEMWAKRTGTTGTYQFLFTDSGSQFEMTWNGATTLTFYVNNVGVNTSNASSLNTWYHIVGTFSETGNFQRIYINGVLANSSTYPGDATTAARYFGSRAGSYPFTGSIDEVKVYNYALTEDEIKLDYNHGSAMVLGTLSDTSGLTGGSVASQSASAAYCIPGDTASCNSPVAEWNFDEKTGTNAYDTSGNGNTGILTNGPTWTTGKIGASVNFNATNSTYVISSNDPGTMSSGTYSLWVKPSTTNASMGWIDSSFDIFQWTGSLLYFRAGNQSSVSISNWSPNTWHHLALMWNGSNYYGYVDGNQVTSGAQSGSRTGQINIGRVDGSFYFTGLIDHVRIYNYARTPAQIAYDYNRGGPVGWWKFDECQGAVANDSGGLGTVGGVGANSGAINIGATAPQTVLGTCTTPIDGTGAWFNGVNGKYNSAMSFDGADDYVSVPSVWGAITQLSFSVWAKETVGTTGNRGIMSNYVASAPAFCLQYETNSGTRNININWLGGWTYGGPVSNNQWQHIAVAYDGTQTGNANRLKIYVNGVLQSVNYSSDVPASMATQSSPFYIGSLDNTMRYYKGLIDDVRIYNYALTPAQIKLLYNENSAVRFGPATGSPQ